MPEIGGVDASIFFEQTQNQKNRNLDSNSGSVSVEEPQEPKSNSNNLLAFATPGMEGKSIQNTGANQATISGTNTSKAAGWELALGDTQQTKTEKQALSYNEAINAIPKVEAKDGNSVGFMKSPIWGKLNSPEFLKNLKFDPETKQPIIGQKEIEHFKKALENPDLKFQGAVDFSATKDSKGGSFLGQTFMKISPDSKGNRNASEVAPKELAKDFANSVQGLDQAGKDKLASDLEKYLKENIYDRHIFQRNGLNVYFVNDKDNPGFHARSKYNLETALDDKGGLKGFSYGSAHGVVNGHRSAIIGDFPKQDTFNFGNSNQVELLPRDQVKYYPFADK